MGRCLGKAGLPTRKRGQKESRNSGESQNKKKNKRNKVAIKKSDVCHRVSTSVKQQRERKEAATSGERLGTE